MNRHRAGPQLLRANAGKVDSSCAVHARRLRRVYVELIRLDDPHAIVLPGRVAVRMHGAVAFVFVTQAALPFNACCSSPDSYISIKMSEPPTNSPLM